MLRSGAPFAACLVLACASASAGAASAAAPDARPRSEVVALRVDVGPDGHVLSSKPLDSTLPLNTIAQQYAAKLTLAPARKDGHAVASSTCLTLALVAAPRPDGSFGLHLNRAINGPCVVAVGKATPPKVAPEQGGLVVLGANLKEDGSVDAASISTVKTELRVPSMFDEARYVDAATKSLRASRFELDVVDGKPVPAHVSAPFRFGGGPVKPKRGEEESRRGGEAPPDDPMPSWNATSTVTGIELPKIDYAATP